MQFVRLERPLVAEKRRCTPTSRTDHCTNMFHISDPEISAETKELNPPEISDAEIHRNTQTFSCLYNCHDSV